MRGSRRPRPPCRSCCGRCWPRRRSSPGRRTACRRPRRRSLRVGRVADLAGAPCEPGLSHGSAIGTRTSPLAVERVHVQREAVGAAFEHRPPLFSLLPVAKPTSARPPKPLMGSVGMRLSITLTTPPTALPPYCSAEGPRSTSMRSVTSAGRPAPRGRSSARHVGRSEPPFCRMRMRSPSWPADHRAARVGAEVGAAHAGQVVERLAQRRVGPQQEFFARERDGRRDQVVGAERIAGDGDGGQAGAICGRSLGASWAWAWDALAKASERTATPMALRRKLGIMVNTR
jgi:hypothetical protein